jgi:hypothetical protein
MRWVSTISQGRGRGHWLGHRRDPEQRVASHRFSADRQRAQRLDVHLVPAGDEGDQTGHLVVAHVPAGHGGEPFQPVGAELISHGAA